MLLAACYVDREPQQHTDVTGGWYAGSYGAHQADDRTVGGLACGGVFCPFTSEPLSPCCTTGTDVSSERAQHVDVCGVDFSGRTATAVGCWERDQPGVPFADCPDAYPDNAIVEEPGCCMSTGVCGSRNVADAIGCHANPGVTQRCDDNIDRTTTCEMTGVYAIRNEVDVYWGGRTGGIAELTDDGRGTIVIDLLVTIENPAPNGLHFDVHAQPCAVRLPAFYSTTLCETYDAQFPDSLWDSGGVQAIESTAKFQCNNPGCIAEIEPSVGLIGIEMDNPEALWPTPAQTPTYGCASGTGADCFPDVDLDGNPASTLTIRTDGRAPTSGSACGGSYARRAVPLSEDALAILDPFSGDNVRRGDRLFLGTRTKLGGSLLLPDNCNAALGVGIAEFIQSRAWGCLVKEGSGTLMGAAGPMDPCRAAEAAFIDENLPIYQVLLQGERPNPERAVPDYASAGPIMRVVRLGALGSPATCSDVRNTVYP